jgi:hypothetical protein
MSHLLTLYLDVVTLFTDRCISEVTANISDTPLHTVCQLDCTFISGKVANKLEKSFKQTSLIIAVYDPYIIS